MKADELELIFNCLITIFRKMDDDHPQNEGSSGVADACDLDTSNQPSTELSTAADSLVLQSATVQEDYQSSVSLDTQEKVDSGLTNINLELIPEDTNVRFISYIDNFYYCYYYYYYYYY